MCCLLMKYGAANAPLIEPCGREPCNPVSVSSVSPLARFPPEVDARKNFGEFLGVKVRYD